MIPHVAFNRHFSISEIRSWGESWVAFGTFAVGGGILILLGHFLFPESSWLIAICAVLLLLLFGYSETQYAKRFSAARTDRLGDNFYYLGLTYTLVSVGHALYAFTTVDRVEKLVSDFSVALLTTLFGVVGRVLLYEKQSPEEAEDAASATAKLRLELEGAVNDLFSFREQIRKALEGASGTFSSSALEMEQTVKSFNSVLKKAPTAVTKAFDRLQESSETLAAQSSKLNESLATLESVAGQLTAQTAETHSLFQEHLSNAMELSRTQSDSLKSLSGNIQALNEPLLLTKNSMASLKDEVKQTISSLDGLRKTVEPTPLTASLVAAKEAADELGRALRNIGVSAAFDAVDKDLSAASKSFTDSISNFARQLAESSPAFTESAVLVRQVAEQLRSVSVQSAQINGHGGETANTRHEQELKVPSFESSDARAVSQTTERVQPEAMKSRANHEAIQKTHAPETRARAPASDVRRRWWWPWAR